MRSSCFSEGFPWLYDAQRNQKTDPRITQQKHADGRAGLDGVCKVRQVQI